MRISKKQNGFMDSERERELERDIIKTCKIVWWLSSQVGGFLAEKK